MGVKRQGKAEVGGVDSTLQRKGRTLIALREVDGQRLQKLQSELFNGVAQLLDDRGNSLILNLGQAAVATILRQLAANVMRARLFDGQREALFNSTYMVEQQPNDMIDSEGLLTTLRGVSLKICWMTPPSPRRQRIARITPE